MPAGERHVTRLEGFSDTVFAFALTLLVVSLEVPTSFGELMKSMREFIPFGLMFAMIAWIWYEHNEFFRRYGLQDPSTILLNTVLLFVVLFYVYPLKFLTRMLVGPFFGIAVQGAIRSNEEAAHLMILYSSGFVLISGTFCLLYQHAWSRRRELELTGSDQIALRHKRLSHAAAALIGCLSIAIAAVRPAWTAAAGFLYFALGPIYTWIGFHEGRARRKLES